MTDVNIRKEREIKDSKQYVEEVQLIAATKKYFSCLNHLQEGDQSSCLKFLT